MPQELIMTIVNDCECMESGECLCEEGVCICDCECLECEIEYISVFGPGACACGGNCGCSSE